MSRMDEIGAVLKGAFGFGDALPGYSHRQGLMQQKKEKTLAEIAAEFRQEADKIKANQDTLSGAIDMMMGDKGR